MHHPFPALHGIVMIATDDVQPSDMHTPGCNAQITSVIRDWTTNTSEEATFKQTME